MSAVLNVVGGPESFCGRMVALVEECVEHLQGYGLVFVGFGLRHLDLSAFARPSLYPPFTGLVIASTHRRPGYSLRLSSGLPLPSRSKARISFFIHRSTFG